MAKKRFKFEPIGKDIFIRVHLWKNPKDRNPKRVWLKDENGRKKRFKDYETDVHRNKNNDSKIEALILADVDVVYKKHGIPIPGEENKNDVPVIKVTKIADLHGMFIDHITEHTSKRTLLPREETTIKDYKRALKYYIRGFGNHHVSKFPPGITEDFMTKLSNFPARSGSKKKMAPATVRKHGIAMNSFFRFLTTRELMDKLIVLELPSAEEKEDVRIRPDSSRIAMSLQLERLVAEHPLEPARKFNNGKKVRSSKGRQFLNHLRAWMVLDSTGMRAAEVWSLPIDAIDLDQGEIKLRHIDEPGGRDHYGGKFNVRFRIKGRNKKTRTVALDDDLIEFLRIDLDNRDDPERWLLDRGDGSNQFTTAGGLTRAFLRHWEALGLKGEAKAVHGSRASVLNEMVAEDPRAAQIQAGHGSLSTTIGSYAGENFDKVKEVLNKNRKKLKKNRLNAA